MSLGTVKVGRLTLTEALGAASERVNASDGTRSLVLKGQESTPPLTIAETVQRHSDIVAHPTESVVPVVFTDKADRSGYYRVSDTGSDLANWQQEVVTADWSMMLERVGTEAEIDLESRLSGPLSRQNDFTVTGERIHAPAQGAYAYSAGTTVPSTMTRTSSDGALTVYRGVPVATHPRWACPLTGYLGGRVRFIDTNGFERSGTDLPTTATGWQLHNGLVRVSTSGTVLDIAAWSGAAWQSKLWDFRVAGTSLSTPTAVTLLRNEPEMVVVRVMWVLPGGPGRCTADFTLRRGHRFVEVWIETQTSATVRVQRSTTEAGTASTGGLTATANDAAGNRYWITTLRSGATTDTTNGALQKAATTTLGLAVGAVVGGSGAVSGDAAADLIKQYAGAPSERVEGVRR